MRLRIRFAAYPVPHLTIGDTPRPDCSNCRGKGGWSEDYGNQHDGEYEGTHHFTCECWRPATTRRLVPLPRWAASRFFGWRQSETYSTPFGPDEDPWAW